MIRRRYAILLIGWFLAGILLACRDNSGDTAGEPDCGSKELVCLGLVTDVGSIKDKSFNQSSWEGVAKGMEAYEAKAAYIETRDAKDYLANIRLFAEKNYDIIVTVGFGLGEATLQAARQYPKIMFIGVDQYQAETLPNVAGLIFEEQTAGFLAGALAALLTKSGTIAAVLGTDLVPPVVAFKEGYEAGSRHVRPDIRIISTYHPGGLDVAFTDPEWGATTAKQAIDQGADVVFAAGGTTGNGGLIETATHPDTFCIGVDTDQWETVPEARPCLVSSALKQIASGVFNLIQDAVEGSFPAGNYTGEVGLAPFHDFDNRIDIAVKDRLSDIEQNLRSGALTADP